MFFFRLRFSGEIQLVEIQLVGWLVGWLVGLLVGWLVCWFII